jgi:hypothetical protein
MSDDKFKGLGDRADQYASRIYSNPQDVNDKSNSPEEDLQKRAYAKTRYTIYIPQDLKDELDFIYRQVNHDIFPDEVEKSVFIETLLRYSLKRLEDIKTILKEEHT